MGGWVTALTAAQDKGLAGAALISAADMGGQGATAATRPIVLKTMAENMESLAGTSPDQMADEVIRMSPRLSFTPAVAEGLAGKPLLVITSDDGLAPGADKLVKAIRDHGGQQVATEHMTTDHSYSGKRIALEAAAINWLQALK
jgi:hypothetical protein